MALLLFINISFAGVPAVSAQTPEMRKVIVTFDDAFSAIDRINLLLAGADIHHAFTIIPAAAITLPENAIEALKRSQSVLRVYEDVEVEAYLDESIPQIRADSVQAVPHTGNGVKVCVIDTGVTDAHPSLPTLVHEWDFVNNDNDAFDDHGHGTHVAGIIASQHATLTGVAPGVSLMAAKVLDGSGRGYTSDVIAGIEWCAEQGADVINMSLGGGSSTNACDTDPSAMAANEAVNKGVTVIAASGNNGYDDRIGSPSCGSSVIAVGSVSKSDNIASYSNQGPELDIVAPGSGIASTYGSDDFAVLSGTSMATPHVAGVAALILEKNSNLTPAQVREILRSTAVDLGSSGFDWAYGYGRVDAYAAYLAADQGSGNDDGDTDPSPPDPEPESQIVFSDDFTSTLTQWNVQGNWQIDRAAEEYVPGTDYSNTVAYSEDCEPQCVLTLQSALNLQPYMSATLRLWRYLDRSIDSGEFLRMQAFDGTSWSTLMTWEEGVHDDDAWHYEEFEIPSALLHENFKIRFIANQSQIFEDIQIDNVEIEAFLPTNRAPVADAGEDISHSDTDGNGEEEVTLDGSASFDVDGSIVSYEWSDGETIVSTSAAFTQVFAVGNYVRTLTVTDNEGASSSDTVNITVEPNASPVANAGEDQELTDADGDEKEFVIYDASSSSDADGQITSYTWSKDGEVVGTGAVLEQELSIGTHVFTLLVTDNVGLQGVDVVITTVLPNASPIADAGSDEILTDSDADGVESVTLDASASYDPDGEIALYAWSKDGEVVGTGATLALELSPGEYEFSLEVEDLVGASAVDTVTISVVGNASPIANAGGDITRTDNNADGMEVVTVDGSASYDPDGEIISYAWSKDGEVVGNTARISEELSVGVHTFTLFVTDNAGAQSSDDVTVTVEEFSGPMTFLHETFDEGLGAWNVSNIGGAKWITRVPEEEVVPGSFAANRIAHADDCDDGCFLTLKNSLDLSGFSSATLSLQRFVDRGLDRDEFLAVEISSNGGGDWQVIDSWTHRDGDDSEWHSEQWDLAAGLLTNNVVLRLVTQQSFSNEIVEVDNILLQAQ